MGDNLQISQLHKDLSMIIIIEGRDNNGAYLRIKKIEDTQNEDLPKHVIGAENLKQIQEEYPGLKCQNCPRTISTANKMYFNPEKHEEIPEIENGKCYCKKHWQSKKVAEEL